MVNSEEPKCKLKELETIKKRHPVNAAIARRFREETIMTGAWIAARLHGDSPSTLASAIYQPEL